MWSTCFTIPVLQLHQYCVHSLSQEILWLTCDRWIWGSYLSAHLYKEPCLSCATVLSELRLVTCVYCLNYADNSTPTGTLLFFDELLLWLEFILLTQDSQPCTLDWLVNYCRDVALAIRQCFVSLKSFAWGFVPLVHPHVGTTSQ